MEAHRLLEYKFINEIQFHLRKSISYLKDFTSIQASTDYEDGNLSFDLTFNMNLHVSVRIRKYQYKKFNDLTIRSRSTHGNKTEIDKIKEGMGQIYFYAYMNDKETKLTDVYIVDVNSLRTLYNHGLYVNRKNNDPTEFMAFDFKQINMYNGLLYKYEYDNQLKLTF
jgi:hypothetical protein